MGRSEMPRSPQEGSRTTAAAMLPGSDVRYSRAHPQLAGWSRTAVTSAFTTPFCRQAGWRWRVPVGGSGSYPQPSSCALSVHVNLLDQRPPGPSARRSTYLLGAGEALDLPVGSLTDLVRNLLAPAELLGGDLAQRSVSSSSASASSSRTSVSPTQVFRAALRWSTRPVCARPRPLGVRACRWRGRGTARLDLAGAVDLELPAPQAPRPGRGADAGPDRASPRRRGR
jgi:hypothetical protein